MAIKNHVYLLEKTRILHRLVLSQQDIANTVAISKKNVLQSFVTASHEVNIHSYMSTSIKSSEEIKKSVASFVYDAISDRITAGEFYANERLTETKLMNEFNVSRGVIRETMSKLAAEGLIVIELNKGAMVRSIDRKDFYDFLQVRSIFESFAAKRTAERINEPGCREKIVSVIEECEKIEKNPTPEGLIDNDTQFHNIIMELCGNDIMASEWRRLRKSRHRIGFLQNQQPEEILASIARHKEILLSILDGDGEKASKLTEDLIRMVNNRIQRLKNEDFERLFNPSKKTKT